MNLSFNEHLETIYTNEFYIASVEAVEAMVLAKKLDQATAAHSRRTSRMSQVLGFAAGLEIDTAIALAVGAELHDVGKEYCLDIISNGRIFTREEKATVQEHPLESQHFAERLFAEDGHKFIPRLSSLLAGAHHTFHRDETQNYPPYTALGATNREMPLLRRVGTLLVIADKTEALTGSGRGYREQRLASEGLVIRAGAEGLSDAALFACSQVVDINPRFNMNASRIAELFMEHAEFLEAAGVAA